VKRALAAIAIAVTVLVMAVAAWAENVYCRYHPTAVCYGTGKYQHRGDATVWQVYHCSCGDDILVRGNNL
jgi:hypothetical protein